MTWLVIAAIFLGGVFLWTQNQTKEFDSKNGIYNQKYWNTFYILAIPFICGFFFLLDYSYVAFTTPSTELNQYGFLYSYETIFYEVAYDSYGKTRYIDQVRYEFRFRNPLNWFIVLFLSIITTREWKKTAITYQRQQDIGLISKRTKDIGLKYKRAVKEIHKKYDEYDS